MIHTAQKFEQELREGIAGIKTTLQKAAYKGMEAAVKRVVDDSKIWSGSFILSNRLGIGEENAAPPTNIKIYAVSAKPETDPAYTPYGDSDVLFATDEQRKAVSTSGYKFILGFPLKMDSNLEKGTREKALNGLLGKLIANKSAIDPFGKIYLTNDATDMDGPYAIAADEYSNNIYTQAFRIAEITAQSVFDKAKKIDKVTDL
jgi:hypothetical protein